MTRNSSTLRYIYLFSFLVLILGHFGANPALATTTSQLLTTENIYEDVTFYQTTGDNAGAETGMLLDDGLQTISLYLSAVIPTEIIVGATVQISGYLNYWSLSDAITVSSEGWYDFSFTTADVTRLGYFFACDLPSTLTCNIPFDNTIRVFGTAANSWETDDDSHNGFSVTGGLKDLAFTVNMPLGAHAAPVILDPANEETITESPAVWFTGTCDSTDDYNTVNVELTDLEDNLVAVTAGICLPADDPSGLFDTGAITGMILFLGNGVYQAQPVSVGPFGEPYIFGATITFTVAVPDNPNTPLPTPPPPPEDCSLAETITEQAACWITQKLSAVMTYLFTPSNASLNVFRTLWDPIKTKAPIGYITPVIAAFNSLSYGGTPAFTLSSMSSLSSVLTPLDTFLGVALWLFIGFWLLRRIAKMEL